MQDLPPVVADDEKAVKNTKRERWEDLLTRFRPSTCLTVEIHDQ
jgi:hypothetical protein